MIALKLKISALLALGIPNLVRAFVYRTGVWLGLNSVRRLRAISPAGPFFQLTCAQRDVADEILKCDGSLTLFGYWPYQIGKEIPDWHVNPFSKHTVVNPERAWWQIPDFDPFVGDIKTVWESSRFNWVLVFAQRAVSGDTNAIDRLNDWLQDWISNNPPYRGPNWKCGQEASIRVMHLAMGALITNQTREVVTPMLDLVDVHLKRIAPTMMYAISQDNNHGTSEAAALFIGGSWLSLNGRKNGAAWQEKGRKWLENRACRLIEQDGSFSQYSLNYHRVMLDTFCMVEIWRQKHNLAQFSDHWYRQAKAATHWLYVMIDPDTGDGPNLGANDGARLLHLTNTDYRDYRPSVQLAMALFSDTRAYEQDGIWNAPLRWLEVRIPEAVREKSTSEIFDDGGYAVLKRGDCMAILRYPRFRFRPSQADSLHVDLWLNGHNLLRDAGTFSYSTTSTLQAYFPGTASHNTVQFDDRDQMPRVSRFLFGSWLRTSWIKPLSDTAQNVSFGAGYTDHSKSSHQRQISLTAHCLTVKDVISGFRKRALLRWRLKPGNWKLDGHVLSDGEHVLKLECSVPISRIEVVDGWESRYYLQKNKLPVLEIEVHEPCSISTIYQWN